MSFVPRKHLAQFAKLNNYANFPHILIYSNFTECFKMVENLILSGLGQSYLEIAQRIFDCLSNFDFNHKYNNTVKTTGVLLRDIEFKFLAIMCLIVTVRTL